MQCTSEVKKNKKEIPQQEYPNKCDSNVKQEKPHHSGNRKFTSLGALSRNINLYKNNLDSTYFLKDDSGKILLENFRYFSRISGGFQAVNKDNELVYYNLKLKELSKPPKPEMLLFCGNVSCWKLRIKDKTTSYIVEKLSGHSGNYATKWEMIDSIAKKNGLVDVNFLNKTKEMEYDGNNYLPETIIINYKNGIGIRKDQKTFTFDSIDTSKSPIKVKCNEHFGYFGLTEIKYKKLDTFVYNLALFELDNGEKGYLDNAGNEYLIN